MRHTGTRHHLAWSKREGARAELARLRFPFQDQVLFRFFAHHPPASFRCLQTTEIISISLTPLRSLPTSISCMDEGNGLCAVTQFSLQSPQEDNLTIHLYYYFYIVSVVANLMPSPMNSAPSPRSIQRDTFLLLLRYLVSLPPIRIKGGSTKAATIIIRNP